MTCSKVQAAEILFWNQRLDEAGTKAGLKSSSTAVGGYCSRRWLSGEIAQKAGELTSWSLEFKIRKSGILNGMDPSPPTYPSD